MKTLLFALLFFSCTTNLEHKKWGYQLQNYTHPHDLTRIYQKSKMIWVIDSSFDGTKQKNFNRSQIYTLQKRKHLVISYLSIGEAEDFRYYYKKMPKDLIVARNPEFPDNYKVKYWDPRWHEILFGSRSKKKVGYLGQIVKVGFDGVYLDIVDAFYELGKTPAEKRIRARQMAELITKISKYGKKANSNFRVFVQNGTAILDFLDDEQTFWDSIDGLGVESVFFGGPRRNDNDLNISHPVLRHIKEFQKQKKLILSVEYISQPKKIKKYQELAKKYQLSHILVAERELQGPLLWP